MEVICRTLPNADTAEGIVGEGWKCNLIGIQILEKEGVFIAASDAEGKLKFGGNLPNADTAQEIVGEGWKCNLIRIQTFIKKAVFIAASDAEGKLKFGGNLPNTGVKICAKISRVR